MEHTEHKGPLVLLSAALLIPPLLVCAATLFILGAAAAGHHPMWPRTDMTLAEAAVLRDAGEILRLIRRGEDPNERRRVRYGLLGSDERFLTPLEAAVAARQLEVVQVLIDNGARVDERSHLELTCAAANHGADEIVKFLKTLNGAKSAVDCTGMRTPW